MYYITYHRFRSRSLPEFENSPTIRTTIGNTYGLRTWIEYGFKHAKNELGWADYRVTDYAEIERWWEIIFSAYSLVSFQCPVFHPLAQEAAPEQASQDTPVEHFAEHPWWDQGQGWKNTLNNLLTGFSQA